MYILLHRVTNWKNDGEHETVNTLVRADAIVAIESWPSYRFSEIHLTNNHRFTVTESESEIVHKIDKANDRR